MEEDKVYDVEIIIFAYDTPLPDATTYKNSTLVNTEGSLVLEYKPEDYSFVQEIQHADSEELTLPIDGDSNDSQALIWFKHDDSFLKLKDLWEKLDKSPSTRPLLHQAWRQTASEFGNPSYVNLIETEESNDDAINDNRIDDSLDDEFTSEVLTDDLLNGKVALSKGRYLHFGHKLNLQRTYQKLDEIKAMSFSLLERKQVKTDELNYFDNPWFGSIVKVTLYTGEENEQE
jgi:hypothetical protein